MAFFLEIKYMDALTRCCLVCSTLVKVVFPTETVYNLVKIQAERGYSLYI